MLQSCYAGLLYTVWTQRNRAVWEHQVGVPEKVMQELLKNVYHRITYIMPSKTTVADKVWLRNVCNVP